MQVETLGLEIEQRSRAVDATQLPALIWVVSAARLEHSHGSKFKSGEDDLSFSEVEGSNFTCVLMCPLVLGLIPNSDFDLRGVLTHVDCLGQGELNLNTDVCSNMS